MNKRPLSHGMISILTLVALFLVLGILGLYVFSLSKKDQSSSNLIPAPPSIISEYACSQDNDCVIGILAKSCCSCPEAINKEIIGTEDWEQYVPGQDYSTKKRMCRTFIACKPCELPNKPICQNGQCQFSSTPTPTENIPDTTSQDFERGWYWGYENQRKPGTPSDWTFTEAGRSSCWHSPQVGCNSFLPEP